MKMLCHLIGTSQYLVSQFLEENKIHNNFSNIKLSNLISLTNQKLFHVEILKSDNALHL